MQMEINANMTPILILAPVSPHSLMVLNSQPGNEYKCCFENVQDLLTLPTISLAVLFKLLRSFHTPNALYYK